MFELLFLVILILWSGGGVFIWMNFLFKEKISNLNQLIAFILLSGPLICMVLPVVYFGIYIALLLEKNGQDNVDNKRYAALLTKLKTFWDNLK